MLKFSDYSICNKDSAIPLNPVFIRKPQYLRPIRYASPLYSLIPFIHRDTTVIFLYTRRAVPENSRPPPLHHCPSGTNPRNDQAKITPQVSMENSVTSFLSRVNWKLGFSWDDLDPNFPLYISERAKGKVKTEAKF